MMSFNKIEEYGLTIPTHKTFLYNISLTTLFTSFIHAARGGVSNIVFFFKMIYYCGCRHS